MPLWICLKYQPFFLQCSYYNAQRTTLLNYIAQYQAVTLKLFKKHWIRYYDTVYERDGINYFWSIKNSNDVLNKFKSKNFQALLLMKGLNKTETLIFLSVVCSLFPKAIFFTFILLHCRWY